MLLQLEVTEVDPGQTLSPQQATKPHPVQQFGTGIIELLINKTVCTYGTFVSLILSLPNLQTLVTVILELKGVLPPTLPNNQNYVLKEL